MSWLGPIAFGLDLRGVYLTRKSLKAMFRDLLRGRHTWTRVEDRFECECGVTIFLIGLDGEWDAEMRSPGRWRDPMIRWWRLH